MAIREQVSGPGKNAKRTDLNVSKQPVRYMSGGSYGEGQELLNLQQGANMAGSVVAKQPKFKPSMLESITTLTAPTQRSEENLMTGSSLSANPITLPKSQTPTVYEVFEELLPYDSTGVVATILNTLPQKRA